MLPNIVSMEITLGNLFTIGAILGGWLVFLVSLKGQIQLLSQALSSIDKRLVAVEAAIAHFSQNTIELAKQGVRLESVVERVADLERIKLKEIK